MRAIGVPLIAYSLLPVLVTGCVTREMIVRSDPPGAAVRINGHEVGATPVTYAFITHGRYLVTVSKPGFQEVTAREMVKAPWHQWIPLDFFTELLMPIHFEDRHEFTYHLQPLKPAERIAVEPPPKIDELLAWLQGSSDPGRRREICVVMAKQHLVAGITALQDAAVRDPDPEVRAAAVQALRVLAGGEALSDLLAALQTDVSPMVRWQAVAELEVLRAPESLSSLLAALNDRDALVRASAVEALRALGDQAAVPAISRRLQDGDIVVRRSACSALGRLKDPTAAPGLNRALRDPDPDVRRRAAKSLRMLKAPESSEALARALGDTDPQVRATVIEALGEFGTPPAVPVAIRYIRSWQPATREAAAMALGRMRDPRAVPVLQRAAAREPNPRTREAMQTALATLQGRN